MTPKRGALNLSVIFAIIIIMMMMMMIYCSLFPEYTEYTQQFRTGHPPCFVHPLVR